MLCPTIVGPKLAGREGTTELAGPVFTSKMEALEKFSRSNVERAYTLLFLRFFFASSYFNYFIHE